MSTTPNTTTVTLNDQTVTLERPSALKGSRGLAILRALTKAVPEVRKAWTVARDEYEAANVLELDRTQARLRYPPSPLFDDNGNPVFEPATINGEPNPRAGALVFIPSPVDSMTPEDWENSGQVLKLPKAPTNEELIASVFDQALELGEDHVYRLLALFTMSNSDVKAYWRGGELEEKLGERAGDLIGDSYADEVLELAVAVGELVDNTFVRKARDLGDRLGNAARLFGVNLPKSQKASPSTPAPSSDGPESSTPTSSTASPEPTADHPAAPSSTSPGTSSPASSSDSRTTPLPSERPQPVEA